MAQWLKDQHAQWVEGLVTEQKNRTNNSQGHITLIGIYNVQLMISVS